MLLSCKSTTTRERWAFLKKYIRFVIRPSHLAHDVAERPVAQTHSCHNERDAYEETLVGDGQVQNVQIGDCLHFGVAEDDVDDERVAEQADDEDGAVQALQFGR